MDRVGKQYDDVVFNFSTKESDHYESKNNLIQREEGHETHNNTEMDDDDDDTISSLEPKVVASKET